MEERRSVPLGGFVFVSAAGVLGAWWAYKQAKIEFRDFRVWLATHELVARRCGLKEKRVPRFTTDELSRVMGGVYAEHVRSSLRRLERAGLLSWKESAIRHLDRFSDLSEDAQAFASRVANHRRRIPVPRRLIRFLSRSSRPVLVATAIGHLLRCMYYRNGACSPSGLCKASWIADRLGVDERNVKAARQELERLGVLIRDVSPQTKLNRFGVPMRFNLAWGGESPTRQSPPRARLSTSESPPLKRTGISLSRSENQKPGTARPDGVRMRTGRPALSRVLMSDLHDPKRLFVLHADAHRAGLVGNSEAERLKFFAAAEHAKGKGTRNPAGLFAAVVRRGLWSFISQADEDAARLRVRQAPWPDDVPPVRSKPVRPQSPVSSNDADRAEIRERIRRSLESVENVAEFRSRHGVQMLGTYR